MPKIRYLHKTREGISSIYPKKSGDILQNMNFSRYYRNRGKFIYGFDPNIIISNPTDKCKDYVIWDTCENNTEWEENNEKTGF